MAWREVGDPASEEDGQSTVEYAVVFAGLLGMVLGLGAFVRAGSDGALARAAEGSLSHGIEGEHRADGLADAFMY
jgi:hypothetical protein